MESILTSIKKMLGIAEEYEHFDPDIIMHINSVFMVLNQLGVGPEKCFFIEDKLSTWADFLDDPTDLQMVKTYIGLKVRLIFDPPASSVVMEAMKQMINECEFRLNIAVDNGGFANGRSVKHVILTDRSTNEDYDLYVDNSNLHMNKSEG